ncbi:MAG: 3-hydroxybutyrate dehydrogenase [Burkholderiaceae bacterium]|nr:3-hydroxybutyrate dehydrogenase [Burkholderiaceae bacterium]
MSQANPFRSKVALVTGSTSGIGLGIARALAEQGADIMLNGFGETSMINGLIQELSSMHGGRVLHHGADMSKPSEIEDMIRATESKLGRIDFLVNNAGIQHVSAIEDFPVDRWDAIIAINLSSAFHTTRCALPGMKKRGFGRIINIASAHGLVASANKSAYVAAKHGIVGLTKTVALECASTPVTCNAICPGWVLTPLVQKQVDARAAEKKISNDDAKRDLLAEKQPSGEFVTPEQLGQLAVFFCSDAATQVRGVAWAMDGGWTAQ